MLFSCSNNTDFDSIVKDKWRQCDKNSECIVDFAHTMDFEWDFMYFYSGGYSLDEINKDLGFELKEFIDIGDRIIFLYKGKVVYHQDWFPNPSEPPENIVFMTQKSKFRLDKKQAKFKITKEGKAYYLSSQLYP